MKILNLFKSPLRRRIEAEITELNTLIEIVEAGNLFGFELELKSNLKRLLK